MCPYLNKADAPCGGHWTLGNLPQAIAYCANRYTACPIYQDAIAHDRKPSQPKGRVRMLATS